MPKQKPSNNKGAKTVFSRDIIKIFTKPMVEVAEPPPKTEAEGKSGLA